MRPPADPAAAGAPGAGRVVMPGRVAMPGRIRLLGPMAALSFPAAVVGLAAVVWLGWPCHDLGCVTPSLVAYGLGLLAVPTALVVGLPWLFGPLNVVAALASSGLLWLLLGRWAAGRATADVDATWHAFWEELAFMVAGVWAGVVGGLVVIALWLTL